jgi:L-serine/L-threonine ammonia-lyase
VTDVTFHIDTPVFQYRKPGIPNDRFLLKMDCFQPIGSFKVRGIGEFCREVAKGGGRHFVSSSGGNGGVAVSYCGNLLNIPTTVVVPETTSEAAKGKIRDLGARVVVHGKVWNEAHQHALEIAGQPNHTYVHPFDHPTIWKGHSSLIDEVARAGLQPDTILVSVGGGGLFNGIYEGVKRQKWNRTRIIAVETAGADSLAQSLKAGKLVTLPNVLSIATSLGASRVSERTFEYAQDAMVKSVVVSDSQAIGACVRFADEYRVLVEPACGASLSLMYSSAEYDLNEGVCLVVVCGGVGVTAENIVQWRQQP